MDIEDDESEGEYGLTQVLPVATFTKFDASKPPDTGMDYLRRVQLEAFKCPDVVVADIDTKKLQSTPTTLFDESNGFTNLPKESRPSLEWQREIVAEFTKLRLKITNIRSTLDNNSLQLSKNQSWQQFFAGFKRCKGGGDMDECISFFDNQQPLLGILLRLSQSQTHRLLVDHVKWLKHSEYTYHRGLWIYSLLACLEKPLQSDVYSTLRDLSRICSALRVPKTDLHPNEIMTSLNLIICIIGRYFNQLDMVDE